MDKSEQMVERYLGGLGFDSIIFEPDGNVTPDFLVDGRIAVEVRRLNQNEVTDSELHGLEKSDIRLRMTVQKLLASLGPTGTGVSWIVTYSVKRPFPPWHQLLAVLRQRLEAFRVNPGNERRASFTIGDRFRVALLQAEHAHPQLFIFGSSVDLDTGGWVFEETQKNLRLCVAEKTMRIARVRHKYPEWWLVLVDRIGYGVDACDRKLLAEHLAIEHDWNKVILLSPFDHTCAFEVPAFRPPLPVPPTNSA